ncbi:MAG TPA: ABC transporter ATP-binding protein [Blastocatellia bacterium]|nr:ABC transporter ATP-binding protein [Blastocatellia bacterium]
MNDGVTSHGGQIRDSRLISVEDGPRAARSGGGPVLLKADSITKIYQSRAGRVVVFEGLNLEVMEGEMVAVVGPSGAGKSTLLHLLGGLDRPTSGSVKLGEFDIFELSDVDLARFRNREVGFVFQLHHLLPEFTALENVMMPLRVRRVPKAEARRLAESVLLSVGLLDRSTHRPGELSGGEQARVALARALVVKPRVLLGDEPTGDLDSKTSESVHELLREVHASHKLTSIIVTHNERLASICDRVLCLEDGRLANGGDRL